MLAGGAAYAAGTIFSEDIADNEVRSVDVRDDGLRSVDIADTAGGSDKVNANTLDGFDSDELVRGGGRLLAARFLMTAGQADKTLLEIPGLGNLDAECEIRQGRINWTNTTNGHVELFQEDDSFGWSGRAYAPFESSRIVHSDTGGRGFSLGFGDDPGERRTAVGHAFAEVHNDTACSFHAQAMFWSAD